MRDKIPAEMEQYRALHPEGGWGDDRCGYFAIGPKRLNVIVSDGLGWDHVSVSRFDRKTPTWEEMSWVKNTFFAPSEWVVQYHPAQIDYINKANVLHLWRPQGMEIPRPDPEMV